VQDTLGLGSLRFHIVHISCMSTVSIEQFITSRERKRERGPQQEEKIKKKKVSKEERNKKERKKKKANIEL
jgi:hypothetical protein